jgi:hypothetical protein
MKNKQLIRTLQERCSTEGPLAPSPELKKFVSICFQALSADFFDIIQLNMKAGPLHINPEIKFILEQQKMMKLLIQHISIEVMLNAETVKAGYPHRPPMQSRYPYQPTIDVITQVIDFFDSLKNFSYNPPPPVLDESVVVFVDNLIELPTDKEIKLIEPIDGKSYRNNDEAIGKKIPDNQNFSFEKSIIDKPAEEFYQLKERIQTKGLNTNFSEFESTIEVLTKKIAHPFISDLTKKHPFCETVRKKIVSDLNACRLNNYPYLKSLNVIMKVLDFFDALDRTYKDHIPALYHSDRYTYYALTLPYKMDYLLIPSIKSLSFLDLIKLRSAPIGMMGVSTVTLFTDGFFNSPKDFFVHDANHNRRFDSYNRLYRETKGQDGYKEFEQFINNKIIPAIEMTHGLSEEEVATRKMMTVILFEFLHEYAFTPDKDSLIEAIKYKPQNNAPFEVMRLALNHDVENKQQLEKRRLPNNNLQSGVTMFGDDKASQEIIVEYFFDRIGLNFLRSVANKFDKSFYENIYWGINSDDLPKQEYRTLEHIAIAAMKVMELFGIDPVKDLGWQLDVEQNNRSLTEDEFVKQKLIEIASENVPVDSFGYYSGTKHTRPSYNSALVANSIFNTSSRRTVAATTELIPDAGFKGKLGQSY